MQRTTFNFLAWHLPSFYLENGKCYRTTLNDDDDKETDVCMYLELNVQAFDAIFGNI